MTRNIVLIGMKSSGKTTAGEALAARLGVAFVDIDAELEDAYRRETGEALGFREIYQKHGERYFRTLEASTLERLPVRFEGSGFVLATGGGTPLHEVSRRILQSLGTVVFLDVDAATLLPRITAGGVPAFFPYPGNPARSLDELLAARRPIYAGAADITLPCGDEPPARVADRIIERLQEHGL
jgi:shikimate kinase